MILIRLIEKGECMKAMKVLLVLAVAISLAVAAIEVTAAVSGAPARRSAKLVDVEGDVEIKTVGSKNWVAARTGAELYEGDMLRTVGKSSAMVDIDKGDKAATVEVKENSEMRIVELVEYTDEGHHGTLIDLSAGEVAVKAKNIDGEKSKFEVKTPTSVVAVQGGSASFSVKVERVDR